MTTPLKAFLRVADSAMLIYWLAAAAACAGLLKLPASAMYPGYGTPAIDAWNWSFAPIDLAFAITGLAAVRLAGQGDKRWRSFAIVSLVLTMCAGGMAISYWALIDYYDAAWWLPNLALLIFPLIWLPRLMQVAEPKQVQP